MRHRYLRDGGRDRKRNTEKSSSQNTAIPPGTPMRKHAQNGSAVNRISSNGVTVITATLAIVITVSIESFARSITMLAHRWRPLCDSQIAKRHPRPAFRSGWFGGPELLWMLWMMPVHVAVRALLGKRGLQWLTAIRTWCGRAVGIGSARVQNPDLRPRNRAESDGTDLVHRHHVPSLANHLPKPCLVLVCEVSKLWNSGTALGALRAARRLRVNDQTNQFVLRIGSRMCAHVHAKRRHSAARGLVRSTRGRCGIRAFAGVPLFWNVHESFLRASACAFVAALSRMTSVSPSFSAVATNET